MTHDRQIMYNGREVAGETRLGRAFAALNRSRSGCYVTGNHRAMPPLAGVLQVQNGYLVYFRGSSSKGTTQNNREFVCVLR